MYYTTTNRVMNIFNKNYLSKWHDYLGVIIALSLLFPFSTVYSQNLHQKDNDFIVAISNNPSFNVGDFILVGNLNTGNTQFLSESDYLKSNYVKKHYNRENFHKLYQRASIAWGYFKQLQYVDKAKLRSAHYNYGQWDVMNSQVDRELVKKVKYIPHSGVKRIN